VVKLWFVQYMIIGVAVDPKKFSKVHVTPDMEEAVLRPYFQEMNFKKA